MATESVTLDTIIPGYSEVVAGTMRSGKGRYLLQRIFEYRMQQEIQPVVIDIFKPDNDKRDGPHIKTRAFNGAEVEATFVPSENPAKIVELMQPGYGVLVIDEANFFNMDKKIANPVTITQVVNYIRRQMQKHVLIGGLSLDFRGETFGEMGNLMASASKVHHQYAICEHPSCGKRARFTQRYTDGKPSHYTEEVYMPGELQYKPVCLRHHIVPGAPSFDLSDKLK